MRGYRPLGGGGGGSAELGGLWLPGVSGNHATTLSTADLQITGDLDLRVKARMSDWSSGGTVTLIAKYASGEGYRLALSAYGVPCLRVYDGSGLQTKCATASVPFADGATGWVRATLDADNGASGYDVRFYTSVDGVTWTQLGTTVTTEGVIAIGTGSTSLMVGSHSVGTGEMFVGTVFEAQVLDGIEGTLVANPVFESPVNAWTRDGATAWDGQRVWTINGSRWEWRA